MNAQTRAEEDEEDKREFLLSVFNPDEFQKVCHNIDYQTSIERNKKAVDYVGYWINQLKGDTPTMERIIETYMPGKFLAGFILSYAIELIEGKDSRYFEELYKRLAELQNIEGFNGGYSPSIAARLMGGYDPVSDTLYKRRRKSLLTRVYSRIKKLVKRPKILEIEIEEDPHLEFKIHTLRHQHPKGAAVRRITDQDFLKRLVDEVPDDCNFGFSSHYSCAVTGITDQKYLENIISTKKDFFLVANAIEILNNRGVLNQFANMPDEVCDQQRYKSRSPEQDMAFYNANYRVEAKKRLWRLDQLQLFVSALAKSLGNLNP